MTSPILQLTDSEATAVAADVLIVGTVQGSDGPQLVSGAQAVAAAFDDAGHGALLELLGLLGASGKADEVVKLPTRGAVAAPVLVATGLGTIDGDTAPSAEQVRRAAGAAARALAGTAHAVSTLGAIDLRAAVEGTALGAYAFTGYKRNAGKAPLARVEFAVDTADKAAQRTLAAGSAIATAVRTARDLVNTPPNDLFPASFAERAVALATDAGLHTEVLDEDALRAGGYGGILGVGGGSSRLPRLVRLRHSPKNPKARVALVGKGITFDTGGISIKPAAKMEDMTSDMAGAAAVVATVVLAAHLDLPVEVIATVPMAENMPSGTAYRPGDVLSLYGGTTVEILNTDAEGRLVLADALVRAAEDEPDYIIDTATLTGAQMVALGTRTPGVMGTPEFRDRVATLSQHAGENAWPMPLPEHLRPDLDSKLADLANVMAHRWGGMLAAGIFLREFVPAGTPWAHLDVAGPAYNTGAAWGYTTKGGTGVPVRTLAAVLTDIAENG